MNMILENLTIYEIRAIGKKLVINPFKEEVAKQRNMSI